MIRSWKYEKTHFPVGLYTLGELEEERFLLANANIPFEQCYVLTRDCRVFTLKDFIIDEVCGFRYFINIRDDKYGYEPIIAALRSHCVASSVYNIEYCDNYM